MFTSIILFLYFSWRSRCIQGQYGKDFYLYRINLIWRQKCSAEGSYRQTSSYHKPLLVIVFPPSSGRSLSCIPRYGDDSCFWCNLEDWFTHWGFICTASVFQCELGQLPSAYGTCKGLSKQFISQLSPEFTCQLSSSSCFCNKRNQIRRISSAWSLWYNKSFPLLTLNLQPQYKTILSLIYPGLLQKKRMSLGI